MTDEPKISRQRAYQLRRIADGLCSICGRNPLVSPDKCSICRDRHRKIQRKAKKCKPWKEGGRGRPPIGAILHSKKGQQ